MGLIFKILIQLFEIYYLIPFQDYCFSYLKLHYLIPYYLIMMDTILPFINFISIIETPLFDYVNTWIFGFI